MHTNKGADLPDCSQRGENEHAAADVAPAARRATWGGYGCDHQGTHQWRDGSGLFQCGFLLSILSDYQTVCVQGWSETSKGL